MRDQGREVTRIVTMPNLSEQSAGLTRPLMLLNEVEVRLRIAIGRAFSVKELASVKDPSDTKAVLTVDDRPLGELTRLLDPAKHWERLRRELDRMVLGQPVIQARKQQESLRWVIRAEGLVLARRYQWRRLHRVAMSKSTSGSLGGVELMHRCSHLHPPSGKVLTHAPSP